MEKAFQEYYPDDYSHCYGCGCKNENGLQIKSFWEGDETVCRFTPQDKYSGGMKDILYGGLIASLIDCHGAATAAAAKARELNIEVKKGNMPRFVTGRLCVDFVAPTPVAVELEVRGSVREIKNRKVTVDVTLLAQGEIRAKGECIMIQIKEE